jgi:hypothetical protein
MIHRNFSNFILSISIGIIVAVVVLINSSLAVAFFDKSHFPESYWKQLKRVKEASSQNDLDRLRQELVLFEKIFSNDDDYILWMTISLQSIFLEQKKSKNPFLCLIKNDYTDLMEQIFLKILAKKANSFESLFFQGRLISFDPFNFGFVRSTRLENESDDEFIKYRQCLAEKTILIFQKIHVAYEKLAKEREFEQEFFLKIPGIKKLTDGTYDVSGINRKDFETWQKLSSENQKNYNMFAQFDTIVNTGTKNDIQDGLINLYNQKPYNSEELFNFLKHCTVDEKFVREILDALPQVETPASSIRQWQSTDGLFKTTAKFISADNKEVVLERVNGKRTTIEFSVLRKEDQDYVKEQLNPETKTPKNETTKD